MKSKIFDSLCYYASRSDLTAIKNDLDSLFQKHGDSIADIRSGAIDIANEYLDGDDLKACLQDIADICNA